jgi:hypothetical protein
MIDIASEDLLKRLTLVLNDLEEDIRKPIHLPESGNFILETIQLRERFIPICTSKKDFSVEEAKGILDDMRRACLEVAGKMDQIGM